MQIAQGHRSDKQDAQQREDGKDENLPVNAQAAYCRDDGKDSTNGEADDEEVTR